MSQIVSCAMLCTFIITAIKSNKIMELASFYNSCVIRKCTIHHEQSKSSLSHFPPYHYLVHIFYWNIQFINLEIIIKTKVLLPKVYVTFPDFAILFRQFGCLASKHCLTLSDPDEGYSINASCVLHLISFCERLFYQPLGWFLLVETPLCSINL